MDGFSWSNRRSVNAIMAGLYRKELPVYPDFASNLRSLKLVPLRFLTNSTP